MFQASTFNKPIPQFNLQINVPTGPKLFNSRKLIFPSNRMSSQSDVPDIRWRKRLLVWEWIFEIIFFAFLPFLCPVPAFSPPEPSHKTNSFRRFVVEPLQFALSTQPLNGYERCGCISTLENCIKLHSHLLLMFNRLSLVPSLHFVHLAHVLLSFRKRHSDPLAKVNLLVGVVLRELQGVEVVERL